MRNAGLEEAQAGIKIAGRNINNLRPGHPGASEMDWREQVSGLWPGQGQGHRALSAPDFCLWKESAKSLEL